MTVLTAFIPGVFYAKGDLDGLERQIDDSIFVPDIPLYRGVCAKGSDKIAVEYATATDVLNQLVREGCRRIIAHSRGSYLLLLMKKIAIEDGLPLPASAILIPASRDPRLVEPDRNAGEPIDMVLRPLCGKMREETYLTFRARHQQTWKDGLRVMDPKKNDVPVEQARTLAEGYHGDVPTLILDCMHDPYRDPHRLQQLLGTGPTMTVSEPIPCGHFPYIECPDLMMEQVRKWEAGFSVTI